MRPPLIPQTIPIFDQDSDLTKSLKTLFNTLVEYREPKTGRIVISLFMCLPSRKDFPEYFNIITKPISMYEIRKRIESNYYTSGESCIHDFKLMFNNCRTFNEDGSMIFVDSIKLEKIVLDRYNQLRLNIEQQSSLNGINGVVNSNNNQFVSKPIKSAMTNSNNNINLGRPPIVAQTAATAATATSNNINTKINNLNHINSQRGLHIEKKCHNHNTTTNIHNNLISQSSNGFPSEDSNSNSNIITSSSVLNEDSFSEIPFQQDVSMDSSSSSVLVDKPSKRSKRDNDQPKKRVLTGYIIYAAEVRKEYVDKNPNQDFGYISRLIGNDWRGLPKDLKYKYEQKALVQNEKLAREAEKREQNRIATGISSFSSSSKTNNALTSTNSNSSFTTTSTAITTTTKKHKSSHSLANKYMANQQQQSISNQTIPYEPSIQIETATQTAPARFVEPPKRMPYNYTEIYKRFLEDDYGEVTYEHVYGHQNGSNSQHYLSVESAERWLGTGIGRHASTGDALWALREFMLQDAATMRWSLKPYQ